ncbi:hypothetical protein EDC94DRAFT_626797 [Helicostylum pulchrum]|nr:hypothetical protein EDC94DRAFT_626797 [Helicostylum pulchrum]
MVQYLPCAFCNSVTATQSTEAICGTCRLLADDQQQAYQDFERSLAEENEYWESDTNRADADLFEEQLRTEMVEDDQQLFINRLRSNRHDEMFRSIYRDGDREEQELYENDQDDFDFNMSYQDNVEAIREGFADEQEDQPFESAHDYSAIALRLLRIVDNAEDTRATKGATESDIATLKTRTSDTSDLLGTNTECAICTETFDDMVITQLPCKHEYHSECIGHWLKLKDSCPICNTACYAGGRTRYDCNYKRNC